MILRKPYALLIKHFKKIHFILTILMVYVVFKCNAILSFFKAYIANGSYAIIGDLAPQYVTGLLYLMVLFILLITVVIYILMRQKQKPTLVYLWMIIFYIILIIVLFQIYNTLSVLDIQTLNPQSTRIYRDITLITILVQYALIALMTVRAVGFDIKKFNFGEDIEDLKIEASDSEEFELTVGVDTRKIRRGLRKQTRELKYFFFENIFIISIILGIFIIVLGVGLYLNFEVYNKVYKEEIAFKTQNFIMKINDSYITHNNYLGKSIAPKNKEYIIVNFNIKSNNAENITLDPEKVSLVLSNKVYYPILGKYASFFDLGVGYNTQKIDHSPNNYIFVFEIDESSYNYNNAIFRYIESTRISSNKVETRYKKVKLTPESLDTNNVVATIKKGEKMWLGQSSLKASTLIINDIEINKSFNYQVTSCINSVCSDIQKTISADIYTTKDLSILHIKAAYTGDKLASYLGINNIRLLINKFGKLIYTINNKNYEMVINDYTPNDYQGEDAYIEVPGYITTATNIKLMLMLRNKDYIYILK